MNQSCRTPEPESEPKIAKHISTLIEDPSVCDSMPVSISDLLKARTIVGFDLAENGRFVIYSSNETGISQLYFLSTKPKSKSKQITYENNPILVANIFPMGKKLVYPQDKDGNEIHHLYALPVEGGEPKRITRKAYSTLALDVHPREKEITRSFASRESCGLETVDLTTEECLVLKEPTPPLAEVKYSHDGKWIATTSFEDFKRTRIIVVKRSDPSDTISYILKNDSRESSPTWSPDDKKLAFVSSATGRNQIVIQEFQGEERTFLDLQEDEEVSSGALWTPEGDKVYYAISKHARSALHGHLICGKREPPLPFPRGSVDQGMPKISKDGNVIAVLHSSITSPYGIYLYKVGSESSIQLTPPDLKIDSAQLVQPQPVWYKSFDGRMIHGWYMPAATRTDRQPAVILAHGGPWGQVSDNWFDGLFMHSLSQNGFACFAPNFRGSTGFGAEFLNLDMGDPGGGDLEDVICGAEWLRKQRNVLGSKIAIMGASYGGYMTLMALTKRPQTFAAGVALVPVVDWLKMYRLSDPAYRVFIDTLLQGPPSKKEKLYRDRSPATHVSKIRAPVMIMAGQKDYRCPIGPIQEFVTKLKEMNHPYKLMLEEKAGHISAILNQEESIPIFTAIVDYLKKTLT